MNTTAALLLAVLLLGGSKQLPEDVGFENEKLGFIPRNSGIWGVEAQQSSIPPLYLYNVRVEAGLPGLDRHYLLTDGRAYAEWRWPAGARVWEIELTIAVLERPGDAAPNAPGVGSVGLFGVLGDPVGPISSTGVVGMGIDFYGDLGLGGHYVGMYQAPIRVRLRLDLGAMTYRAWIDDWPLWDVPLSPGPTGSWEGITGLRIGSSSTDVGQRFAFDNITVRQVPW